jgi:hypothetical protein
MSETKKFPHGFPRQFRLFGENYVAYAINKDIGVPIVRYTRKRQGQRGPCPILVANIDDWYDWAKTPKGGG